MQENVTKRPGRPKSEEKADAIRNAAIDLFMADGMERTSMDAIAAAAGVSKQTVYSHFKCKDDLFRDCVASKVQTYGLDPSSLPAHDGVDRILAHIGRAYLTLLSDPGVVRMFRLMVSEAETHAATVKSFHESGPVTTTANIAHLLERYLPDATEELTARATSEFLTLIRGEYWVELLLGTRSEIRDEEMNAHVDHCVKQIHKLYDFK
ncbi:MAG: TetR/AcrR family transcriptional regulator [Woeseiaceae bacterium]